jgi:hypothetical protein
MGVYARAATGAADSANVVIIPVANSILLFIPTIAQADTRNHIQWVLTGRRQAGG